VIGANRDATIAEVRELVSQGGRRVKTAAEISPRLDLIDAGLCAPISAEGTAKVERAMM